MKTDLPAKNRKNAVSRKFKFQININRLSKKNKQLRGLDADILQKLRGKNDALKGIHRGGGIYYDICVLNNVCKSSVISYDLDWFVMSQTLSYIHDICSVKASPDNYKEFISCEPLLDMFIQHSKQNGVKRLSLDKYTCVVSWFTSHLYRTYKYNHIAMRYSRDKNFNNKYEVRNKGFSYSILIRFIDFLVDKGYVLSYKGNVLYGVRCMSMLIVNPVVYDILGIGSEQITKDDVEPNYRPSVVVRDNEGVEVPLDKISNELKSTVSYGVDVLDKYNKYLNSTTVTIDNYEVPEIWFTRIHRVDHTVCSRVFDDGTIQGKTKFTRSLIEIDGEPTVSLDFKSIHPSILLYRKGVGINDHDPYPQLPNIKVDKKLVNRFKKFYNITSYSPVRNIVKKLMLCLINADSVEKAVGACYKDLSKDNLKRGTYKEHTMRFVGLPRINLHEVALQIINHNEVIGEYLGTGVGNKLQKVDSDIIMICLDQLTKADIPVLPIHDALICKRADKDVVEGVMAKAFVSVVGEGSENNCIIEEE